MQGRVRTGTERISILEFPPPFGSTGRGKPPRSGSPLSIDNGGPSPPRTQQMGARSIFEMASIRYWSEV